MSDLDLPDGPETVPVSRTVESDSLAHWAMAVISNAIDLIPKSGLTATVWHGAARRWLDSYQDYLRRAPLED